MYSKGEMLVMIVKAFGSDFVFWDRLADVEIDELLGCETKGEFHERLDKLVGLWKNGGNLK